MEIYGSPVLREFGHLYPLRITAFKGPSPSVMGNRSPAAAGRDNCDTRFRGPARTTQYNLCQPLLASKRSEPTTTTHHQTNRRTGWYRSRYRTCCTYSTSAGPPARHPIPLGWLCQHPIGGSTPVVPSPDDPAHSARVSVGFSFWFRTASLLFFTQDLEYIQAHKNHLTSISTLQAIPALRNTNACLPSTYLLRAA